MKTQRAILLVAFLGLSFPAVADAIAFITNLKGDVSVDGHPRPMLLSELAKGQRVSVGKDSTASVMYIASGKEYVLRGPSEYQVRDTEMTGSTPMPPVLRSTEWRASNKVLVQVANTSAASVRMRSIAKPAKVAPLLYPTEGNVTTLQPTFRWNAAESGPAGEIAVFAVGEERPVHAAKAAGGSYRMPGRLKPETDYAWTYTVAGNEVGSGRFRTASLATIREVEKRRPLEKAEFSDRLMFALLLHEVGAVQEAREAWARLASERNDLPELSALAR
ncbi:MAG TPA: hypothetical protein VEC19_00745 [Usitatibacter sp.]|nr:hypothetical protein [Usitatibacter sp.]